MPKLYLVGVTEDRSGIVLSKSARSKSGDSVLEIDADVLEAIAEIRRYRSGSLSSHRVSSPALPTRRPESDAGSRLSPREIQDRLRHGESIKSVAKRAGIDEWRVEVYAGPILAEQARIVTEARAQTLAKRGAGPSGVPLGEAVVANLVDKKLGVSRQEYDGGWSAFETSDGQWVVRFEYVSRGRPQRAEWEYEEGTRALTASNRLATVLGWRDPKARRRTPRLPDAAPVPPTAVARKKAARKKAAPKRKAAPKKAPAKKPAAPKRPAAPKKAPAKKPAAPKRPAAPKKAPAKKAPAKKPAAPKRPAAPKKAPAKKPAAPKRPAAPKKAPAKKAPAKKAPAKKAPAKQAPARAARPATGRAGPARASTARASSRRTSTSGRTSTTRRSSASTASTSSARGGTRSGRAARPTRTPRDARGDDDLATRPFRLLDALLAEEEAAEAGGAAPEAAPSDDEALEPPAWIQESARRRSTPARGDTARSGGGARAARGPSIKAERAGTAARARTAAGPEDGDGRGVVDLDEYRSASSASDDDRASGGAVTSAASAGSGGSAGSDGRPDAPSTGEAEPEAPRRRGLLRRQRPLRAR